jgi:hypothetical protein
MEFQHVFYLDITFDLNLMEKVIPLDFLPLLSFISTKLHFFTAFGSLIRKIFL